MQKTLTFNPSQYETIENFIHSDEMFWSDLYLHISPYDGLCYLYDTSNDNWYNLEKRFDYDQQLTLFMQSEKVEFYLIDDDSELTEQLYNEYYF